MDFHMCSIWHGDLLGRYYSSNELLRLKYFHFELVMNVLEVIEMIYFLL